MTALVHDWRPDWPCPVGLVLAQHRRGGGDPTYRVDEAGRIWRGIRTPAGPATLCIASRPRDGVVHAEAWGDGAAWVLESLPAMRAERQKQPLRAHVAARRESGGMAHGKDGRQESIPSADLKVGGSVSVPPERPIFRSASYGR